MEENKELNTELQEEVVEESAVEVEEMAEEASEEAEGIEVCEECERIECAEKSNKTFVIVSLLVSLMIVVLSFITSIKTNKYNNMGYVDIYGETVQEMAEKQYGMSLEDFLETYELPSDMPGDTNSNAAENMVPAGVIAQEMATYLDQIKSIIGANANVSNFELFKLISGMPAEVTESTPIGEAKGMVKLKYIVEDEAQLEEFKKMYGLNDSVTLETEFKEVRTQVDTYTKAKYEEKKALQEQIMQQMQQAAEEKAEEKPAE